MSFPKYEAYKDSGVEWLGAVPEHWRVSQLKHLLDIQNGSDHKSIETEDGVPVFGSGGSFAFASKHMFDGESVLLGRKGTVDKPMYLKQKFWAVDTVYWSKIRPEVSGKFAFYSATTIPFGYYSTNTALPSMTKSALGSHASTFPSYAEQQSIARFLDSETSKIDTLVALQARLIELLKEKRQAVISHAVTKGLSSSVPMKESGVEWLKDVPEHWGVTKLKYLCKTQTGNRDTAHAEASGEYPFFVRSQNIERISTYSADCEAVLTAGDGVGVGKVFHYINGRFDFHQRVYMFNNFQGVSGAFFYNYLAANFYKIAMDGGAKTSVDSLRMPVIANFVFTVPPLDEQSLICTYISLMMTKLDSLIVAAERSIDLLKERRSALISAAVTGKIDVRGFVEQAA